MKKAETKDRIKEAMEMRGIKQAELVEKTGIDKGQMSSYLSGKYKPKQRNINLIAQALSVDEAWLMGYEVPIAGCFNANEEYNFPEIIKYYNLLNDIGKYVATKRVKELTYVPEYTTKKENKLKGKEEIKPRFTEAEEATKYLASLKTFAAFGKMTNEISDADKVIIANIIYASNEQEK